MNDSDALRFAELALASVHREYPYHLVHLLRGDDDVRPPRELTPAFFGSFDWHSAVHAHWTLVRLSRILGTRETLASPMIAGGPNREPVIGRCRSALDRTLTSSAIAGELVYLSAPDRAGFERPYGLAWLLQLAAELREWSRSHSHPSHGDARRWLAAIEPLETLAARRLSEWLPRLPWPIRSGEHSQTAFSLGLTLDWARDAGDASLTATAESRARAWFGSDRDAPIAYEPSGHDFLSPALGEADLMRRVLPEDEFSTWLHGFLPTLETPSARAWLTPVASPDPADGKLSHLDGLNLSRAWMLEGVAHSLPAHDPRRAIVAEAARRHADAGLEAVSDRHYAGAHWLGSFATYLVTRRGRAHS